MWSSGNVRIDKGNFGIDEVHSTIYVVKFVVSSEYNGNVEIDGVWSTLYGAKFFVASRSSGNDKIDEVNVRINERGPNISGDTLVVA